MATLEIHVDKIKNKKKSVWIVKKFVKIISLHLNETQFFFAYKKKYTILLQFYPSNLIQFSNSLPFLF